jgi:hypothetical protein
MNLPFKGIQPSLYPAPGAAIIGDAAMGVPAEPCREVTAKELARARNSASHYIELAALYREERTAMASRWWLAKIRRLCFGGGVPKVRLI